MRAIHLLVLFPFVAAPVAAQHGTPATPPANPAHPAAAPAPAPVTPGYGAWFGSQPSMDEQGNGVLLEGVTDGSPAQRAGIRAGDLLVKMGTTNVNDLTAMTQVLRSRKPGDTLDVVVKRGTESRTFRVVLGIRP
jgi:S1-C subfamily serine protease